MATTAQGLVSDSRSTSKMSVAITKLNLLNGLINADALTGEVSASKASGAAVVSSLTTTFVNLMIAGNTIPVDVAPNTVINIANVAKVTVNAQLRVSRALPSGSSMFRSPRQHWDCPSARTSMSVSQSQRSSSASQ